MKSLTKISLQAEAHLPTSWGDFVIRAFTNEKGDYSPHLVLSHPELDASQPVIVRIHSECITGDIFHSLKCDCGQQLDMAMQLIAAEKGVLIYMRQEGRGIGIINKLKAYKHQESGMDTIEANAALGLKSDYRHYDEAVSILKQMDIKQVRLITNNPDKIHEMEEGGIEVVDRIPVVIPSNTQNHDYLKTKRKSMGHML